MVIEQRYENVKIIYVKFYYYRFLFLATIFSLSLFSVLHILSFSTRQQVDRI